MCFHRLHSNEIFAPAISVDSLDIVDRSEVSCQTMTLHMIFQILVASRCQASYRSKAKKTIIFALYKKECSWLHMMLKKDGSKEARLTRSSPKD